MAIRLRKVNGIWIALCAAESSPQKDDLYLDDRQHHALTEKFSRDFNRMFDCGIHEDPWFDELLSQQ